MGADQLRVVARLGVSELVFEPCDDGGYEKSLRVDCWRENQGNCSAVLATAA